MVTLSSFIPTSTINQLRKSAEISQAYKQQAVEKAHLEAHSENAKRMLFPEQYKPRTSSIKPLKGWRPRVS